MKTLLIVIIVSLIIFYIFRPTSKKRIKKNLKITIIGQIWDFKIAATFSDGEFSVIN